METYLRWKIFRLGRYLDSNEGEAQIQTLFWRSLPDDLEDDSIYLQVVAEFTAGLSYNRTQNVIKEISRDLVLDERGKRWIEAIEMSGL